ncbi:MAG TPA: polysaccharide biosynthesis tyrosine autokinase [Candidatus Baltobacteraceae bacterium]|nr:polysaccharide biosynthesis tyrosine autokinase [Candidatus Baltobacteraceae bacterium]
MYSLPAGQPVAATTATESTQQLHGIVRTLQRRIRPMIAIFLGFIGLVLIFSLLVPKSYTTEIKVIAGNSSAVPSGNDNTDTQLPFLNALLAASGVQSAETYVELFQETPVAGQVSQNLRLGMSAHDLLQHVNVKPITNTSIIDLAVTWSNPKTSALVANEFGRVVVDRQRQLVSSQAQQAIDFLSKQLPQANKTMHEAQTRLADFEATHHIADINAQTQSYINTLGTLDGKIGQTQADMQQARAQLGSVSGQLAHTPASITGGTTVATNPVLQQLQTQLSQVDVQLQTARQQYTDQHPTVIALRQQEAQLKDEIARQQSTVVANTNTVPNPLYQQLQQQQAQYQAQVAADQAQIGELQRQRTQLNPTLAKLPAQAAQLADLQRAAQSAQDVYGALQQKFNNANIAKDTALSDVTVTQPATPGSARVTPNLMLNLLLGILLGLTLAIVGAFVIDYLDGSIKDEREVEEELALPPLAQIPLVRMRNGVAALPWVRTLTIESFLQLVTSIKYASDSKLETLVTTSPSQGDGKSTISVNVALAMAELEPRVLLVDADLRRASIHTKLHMKNERGLSDVLVGRAKLGDVVQKTKYPGLDILTSGTPTPNPIKLLESQRMDDMLGEASQQYRCVIVDTAALSVNLDAAVVSRKVDGTVVVLSAGSTDLREAKNALRRLTQVGVKNILGFVLNRVVPRRSDYGAYELGPGDATAEEEPMITA